MTETIHATTATEWRSWLADNHDSAAEVWLVIRHKGSGVPSLRYAEAIEHALCYGWIDGLHRKHDATSSRLRFSPRRPASTWSELNRGRATRMIEAGLMTEPGQALVDLAKRTGTWHRADRVPDDLRTALDANPAARDHFAAFPPSAKRLILEWVVTAKRPATRAGRIAQTVTLAAHNIRAHQPTPRQPTTRPREDTPTPHPAGREPRRTQPLPAYPPSAKHTSNGP